MVSMPNIMGMNHSIILFIDCCWAPPVTGIIFCCSHMEPATKRGRTRVLSGRARFSHRNPSSKGTMRCINGQE